ncbi:hypothetical protein K474DRAFT_895223 [Panus rudis PR-1116 ss-1]|nr:hypothetical protein K474DRAFT_895223 [Panus rudis PR-1116 ss-1]
MRLDSQYNVHPGSYYNQAACSSKPFIMPGAPSPQFDWENWEAREPGDPMKTYQPYLHEEDNPTGENLEAWNHIAGEFGKLDARETNACKEDMDTLIMVAGLFAAVFATFNVDSYKQLQPSSEGASVYLLAKIAHHLNETSVTAEAVEDLRTLFQPSSSVTLVNALWFSGLVLSLMTAAGAMSIKRWLREYNATTVHLPHHYCRLRFFRHRAFTTYKVYDIAASLPCILQCALTFFLAGLACFLWSLNTLVFGAVLFPLLIWLALYVAAIVLSIMDPACPYTIPIIGNLYKFILFQILRIKVLVYGRLLGRQEYQYTPHMSAVSPRSFDSIARIERHHDAMVLVSAFSTFRTEAINQQVMKAFRTVHLGRIHGISFLKFLFSHPGPAMLSPELRSHLQPAVKTLLIHFVPSGYMFQALGVHKYLQAVAFVFSSRNVGRSRMLNIVECICALPDEHLSSQLVEHVLDGISPCFDFYKKNRWSIQGGERTSP